MGATPAEAIYYIKKKKETVQQVTPGDKQPPVRPPIVMPAAPLTPPAPQKPKIPICTDKEREALRNLNAAFAGSETYNFNEKDKQKQAAQQKKFSELMAFLEAPGNVEKFVQLSFKCSEAPVPAEAKEN